MTWTGCASAFECPECGDDSSWRRHLEGTTFSTARQRSLRKRLPIGLFETFTAHRRGDPLFKRLTILRTPWFTVKLHRFHRADPDCLHDHPWDFVSLILWGGYFEVVPVSWGGDRPGGTIRLWNPPGSLLFRHATFRHRVIPPPGRKPITLVLTGPRVREWGFWTNFGWRPWHSAGDLAESCHDG